MKLIQTAALSAMMCLASATAFAESGMDLIKKMETQFQGVKSVQGSFSQSGVDPVFKKEVTVPATFQILKPGYFKAEYRDSSGQLARLQLISGKTYYHYVPKFQQVNKYEFKNESSANDLSFLLLGFGAKVADVSRVYSVKDAGENGALLEPRDKKNAAYKSIEMKVDPKSYYPVSFTMVQSDDSKVRVSLDPRGLQINPSLSENNFTPNFPKGVQIVPAQ